MNLVLLADKKIRKGFEAAVKDTPNITLLGVEMVIRGNTMSRIADHHNPHTLVIYKGVPEKDGITVQDLISFLHVKKPALRMIFVYGKISDNVEFANTVEFLLENGITDIVPDTAMDKVVTAIENPMTEETIQAYLEELFATDTPAEEHEVESTEATAQEYEKLQLDFPSVTARTEFDMDKIMTVTHNRETDSPITIGIAALQHHNGCTHTAFEIAGMLSKKYSAAIMMADKGTLDAYAGFHKIATGTAAQGLSVQGIDVFPIDKLQEISGQYSATICDFGYFREEYKPAFRKCDVKIMLCSAAEWDIPLLLNYVNYPSVDYIHDIHFCFSRVTGAKFSKYCRQLMKSGFIAYRLHNSPDWTTPHKQNEEIYRRILQPYKRLPTPEKQKRKLFKVK